MININDEKNRSLSTQEVYDIVDMSIQMAEDNGFINDFVLQRALILNTMIVLDVQDCKEGYAAKVADNPLLAWDEAIESDLVQFVADNFKEDIEYVCMVAAQWAQDYIKFSNSARGLLAMFSSASDTAFQDAAKQLQELTNNADVKETLEIADKWGMNNTGKLYQEDYKVVE